MKYLLHLDRDDCERLPYAVICEARYSARWDTGRRKRLWSQEFTESERKKAADIFKKARRYYLVSGCPDELIMAPSTLALWRRLGDFCASL